MARLKQLTKLSRLTRMSIGARPRRHELTSQRELLLESGSALLLESGGYIRLEN